MNNTQVVRDIKLDIIGGKYKCISAYKIPDKVDEWLTCPNCNLKPLVWEYNNGRSTGCGCGENEYSFIYIERFECLNVFHLYYNIFYYIFYFKNHF